MNVPESAPLPHGGDTLAAEAAFGRPSLGWLDLSTGINPTSYPLPHLPPDIWHRLPRPDEVLRLCGAAAERYGVDGVERVVAAPGTQCLIQWLPRLVGERRRVAVVGPTYAEHAAAWKGAGHEVEATDELDTAADVVVVVNPNNPDGRLFAPDELLAAAAALHRKGGLLVVDEAFADTVPDSSIAGCGADGAVVLRSFGKFFGLAGLRLGFAVAPPSVAEALRGLLGPWAVGGPAIAVGEAALSDSAWIAQMRASLEKDAARLDAMLLRCGLSAAGGMSLFRLTASPDAPELYRHLGRQGILVRAFPERPRHLRFGLPGGMEAWDRLARALAEWTA